MVVEDTVSEIMGWGVGSNPPPPFVEAVGTKYLRTGRVKDDPVFVSYIRISLRFWYYASLSNCCQNLEKNWGQRKALGESEDQTFKGSDREKCQFWYFGNFQHQVLCYFLVKKISKQN